MLGSCVYYHMQYIGIYDTKCRGKNIKINKLYFAETIVVY